MPSLTQPLSPGQQMLLQRLMAAHVLSHEDAEQLFQKVNDVGGIRTLEDCFRSINEQLMAGFSLEIATVVIDRQKYHSVVNPHANDVIAKGSFSHALPPAEREYARKVLENLVENNQMTRMDLINLRTGTQIKLSVDDTENCLDRFQSEGWISIAETTKRRQSLKTEYVIGPRSYLELRHLLQDFGLEDLPQCIYHRAV